MASKVYRAPGGRIIYKAANHLDIPEIDLVTFLLDSPYTKAREDSVLHVDCNDPKRTINKAQTRQLTRELAYALRHDYGIGRDGPDKDVVLVVTTGDYRLQTLFFGTVAAGGVYAAASPSSTASELAFLAGLVEPTLIVCNSETSATVAETIKKIDFPADRVLYLGNEPGLDLTIVGSARKLALSPSRLLDWARITDLKKLEDSVICVLFSSGTTGFPKGVKISHRMLVAETFVTMEPLTQWQAREKPGLENRTLAHVPAAHVAGIQGYLVSQLYVAGTVFWMQRFDLETFLEYNKRLKITNLFSVPPIYLAIAKHPAVKDQFDNLEYAISGAAPLGAQLQLEAESKFGRGKAKLTQVWGLTETTGAITMMPPGEGEYTGSVGPLVANHEARIVDDDGNDVEPGEAGEIWVRGPVVTKGGYWRNPKANQESFVEDWFCTGDVALFKNGMFYIVDRKKELIKYKGLQVAPAELEALLLSHSEIVDAAVIGVEGEGTEIPRAYVVASSKNLTSAAIVKWVNDKVANHKKLRGGVVLVASIPKSPSGKILRKALREQAQRADRSSKL